MAAGEAACCFLLSIRRVSPVPFLLTGLGINQFLSFYGKFRQHLHKVEVVSGVILIVIGVLVMSNRVDAAGEFASGGLAA